MKKLLSCNIMLFLTLLLTVNLSSASEGFVNYWKSDINLTVNGNDRWIIKKDSIYNLNAFNICEEYYQNNCLNIETGSLRSSNISPTWLSALWFFEDAGDGKIRIKNIWKENIYIHIEYGYTTASSVLTGWYSAQWKRFTHQAYQNAFVNYTSFNGREYSLKAYNGRNISLLVNDISYENEIVNGILTTLDNAFDEYKSLTGREPSLFKHRNGLLTIAVVDDDDSCGAGCGYLGSTGIEIRSQYFNNLYDNVKFNNKYDQILFYELGRNFWFYGDKIDRKEDFPNSSGAITTGYAVFMRFHIMDKLGLNGLFNGEDLNEFKNKVNNIIDVYLYDYNNNFDNTIALNKSPVEGTGATDLFASFIFKLKEKFGDRFIDKLWIEVGELPAASSSIKSSDNFIVAASIAANQDLRNLFVDEWRWPALGSNSENKLDNLFLNSLGNKYIEKFYSEFRWYFGNKVGGNYTCDMNHVCQDFIGGHLNLNKTIKIELSSNGIYWKYEGSPWYYAGIKY